MKAVHLPLAAFRVHSSIGRTLMVFLVLHAELGNRSLSVSEGTKQITTWFASVLAHAHSKNFFG